MRSEYPSLEYDGRFYKSGGGRMKKERGFTVIDLDKEEASLYADCQKATEEVEALIDAKREELRKKYPDTFIFWGA